MKKDDKTAAPSPLPLDEDVRGEEMVPPDDSSGGRARHPRTEGEGGYPRDAAPGFVVPHLGKPIVVAPRSTQPA